MLQSMFLTFSIRSFSESFKGFFGWVCLVFFLVPQIIGESIEGVFCNLTLQPL